MGILKGVCSSCGKIIFREGRVPTTVVCDCYRRCPLCGAEMTPYRPDLDPKSYGGERNPDLEALGLTSGGSDPKIDVVFVCLRHSPPYYSRVKPVEVALE